jgi:hypothetical protein
MGITASPNSQPSISGLNPDGTVAGSQVQDSGSQSFSEWSQDLATIGAMFAGALAGFAMGGLPGAIVGAYFGPTNLQFLSNTDRTNIIQDEINERTLRDLGSDLRGSAGTDDLGSPVNYTGSDANRMMRDSSGENILFPSSSPPNLKPWVVKVVRNQTLTTRDRQLLGVFMLTIKSHLVTETIQGFARARVACTSIPQLPPDLYAAEKTRLYNLACQQIGPLFRGRRDAALTQVNLTRAFNTAKKKPIAYSRTTTYYTFSGVKRSERYIARYAMARLIQSQSWGTVQKKVMGRWARAALTTSTLTSNWCRDVAKKNSTRKTFALNQIAAAKLQF